MPKLRTLLALALLSTTAAACVDVGDLLGNKSKKSARDDDDDDDDRKKKKKKSTKADDDKEDDKEEGDKDAKKEEEQKEGIFADTGFRPEKDGYAFRNTGGRFPLTPPVVNEAVMLKLFGRKSCVKNKDKEDKRCKLTPAAEEWAFMINRAMNGGQCEGMAVSALTFFKGHDKPDTFMAGAGSTHKLQRDQVTPLIGYYWAYQAVNPVMTHVATSRYDSTPVSVEDKLVEMWKKKELATLGFWGPPGQGGHAVTPYAIEDKGNGIHHILIYDNNYPDTERYIIIDRNANTWKYDVAAINPDVPKMPWGGNAESHSIVVIPLELRLKKAECPFCKKTKKKKTVVPRSTSIVIEDDQGRKLGVDGGKDVNEIPEAEVVDLTAFLDGVNPEFSKMYVVPDESDYDIVISGNDKSKGDDNGVTVFGDGAAFTIDGVTTKSNEQDMLSIGRAEDGIRFKPAGSRKPAIKVALDNDDENGGMAVRVANLKSDSDGEVDFRVDRKQFKVKLGAGSKSSDSYDLKIRHVQVGEDDNEVEEKGIKFNRPGESHDIDAKPAPKGTKPTLKIGRGSFTPKLRLPKKRLAPLPPKPTDAPKPNLPAKPGPKPTVGAPPAPRPVLKK